MPLTLRQRLDYEMCRRLRLARGQRTVDEIAGGSARVRLWVRSIEIGAGHANGERSRLLTVGDLLRLTRMLDVNPAQLTDNLDTPVDVWPETRCPAVLPSPEALISVVTEQLASPEMLAGRKLRHFERDLGVEIGVERHIVHGMMIGRSDNATLLMMMLIGAHPPGDRRAQLSAYFDLAIARDNRP